MKIIVQENIKGNIIPIESTNPEIWKLLIELINREIPFNVTYAIWYYVDNFDTIDTNQN